MNAAVMFFEILLVRLKSDLKKQFKEDGNINSTAYSYLEKRYKETQNLVKKAKYHHDKQLMNKGEYTKKSRCNSVPFITKYKDRLRYESVHGKAPILDRDKLLYYMESARRDRWLLGRQNWTHNTKLNKTDKLHFLGASTVQGDSLCRGTQLRVMKYALILFSHVERFAPFEIDYHSTMAIIKHTYNTFRIKPREVI
jgi:hypothetical protein